MDFRTEKVCYNLKTPLGFHFGILYNIPLTKHLSILPGFLLTSKGTDYLIDTITYSLAPTYLEISSRIAYTIGSKKIRFLLFTGPYSAVAIGGYEIIDRDKFRYINFGNDPSHDLKPFDFGFGFGMGISIKNLSIIAQLGIGLTDISPADNLIMKNKVIGFSVIRLK